MFEKITETRMRLSEEHGLVIAAMLVTLRNECLAGIEAGLGMDDEWVSRQVQGSSANYKTQIQALDRVILRIGQSWDVRRLSLAMNIYTHAKQLSSGRKMRTDDLDKASQHYGVGGFNGGRDRIESSRDDSIPSAEGDVVGRPHPSGTGSTGDDPQYVDARPGGHPTNTQDSGGTGQRSQDVSGNPEGTATRDGIGATEGDNVPT